jgi:hypothetical protein
MQLSLLGSDDSRAVRESEGWAENVEEGDSGVDEGSEHLLAAALHVRDAPSQIVQPLERRLPLSLLRVPGGLQPGPRGRRGGVLPLGRSTLRTRHPPHEVGDPPDPRHGGRGGPGGGHDRVPRRGGRRAEPRGGGHPAGHGLDLDARRGGGDGERGDAGEDRRRGRGHGRGRVDDGGGDGRRVGGEVGGRGGRGPGGHGARRGGDPREVPRGPAQRARGRREAGRVLPAQRGAGLGLERGERDQGVAEAAVRVGEAEEVVQQALRERGRAEAAQRVLRLRVVQQAGERREHAAQPRRGLGHGLRGGPRRQAAHQRPQVGDVVVELEHQRVEPARQARRPRAVGDGLVVGGAGPRWRRRGPGRRDRDRAAESDHHPHTSTPALFGSIDYRAMD